MAGKFYAVKKGSVTGVFETWEECRASVAGYPGAVYKSFKTKEEAEAFLHEGMPGTFQGPATEENESSLEKPVSKETDCVKIYVDGSYHTGTEEFSYGMVVLKDGREETFCEKFADPELSSMHNVAGEIFGARAAMQYALDNNIDEIAIYHDYEGIARWCLGDWKTNKEGTKAYKAFYDEASKQVKVHFVKVTGHSNDKYNDMADELAKEALGLSELPRREKKKQCGAQAEGLEEKGPDKSKEERENKRMKVLMINGSPNEKGCTYTALSEVAETLNACGIETDILQIGKQAIRGCVDCRGCQGKERCVFNDDVVNKWLDKMEQADGLIIGSPVYFASPNGNLLSLLDRFFFAGRCFAHKPAAAVVSARRAGTTASLEVIEKYFTIRHMPIVSASYWNMVHGSRPEEVAQDLEGLQTMRNLGKNMAWMLQCIVAGKEKGILPPVCENQYWTNFIR